MGTLDTIIPARPILPGSLESIARTPILRGRSRKFFQFTSPDLTLNAQEYNSVMVKTPSDALFLVRQIYTQVDLSVFGTVGGLSRARISVSSDKRPNMALSNDLLTMETMGGFYPFKIPHVLYMPTPIMPGSLITFEAQNLDPVNAHTFKILLEGELIYQPDKALLDFFSSYSWFQYGNNAITPDTVNPPQSFTEIRTHPDSDFYITHFLTTQVNGFDPAISAGLRRIRIYLGSQGEPIMDSPIHTVNLCGTFLHQNNNTGVFFAQHAAQPNPLPYPIRVPAGSSLFLQCFASIFTVGATPSVDFTFEGIKVFI